MIVLSYGMTKSGSTLAFELCKSILEQRGYTQRKLPDDAVTPGHHINFLTDVTVKTVQRLLDEVSSEEKIAIKVHAPIGVAALEFVQARVDDGAVKVHVNFRDPREVSLSLVDAGAQARAKDRKAFSEIHTLEDAAKVARRQLAACRQWGSIRGTLHLFYNDVAFDTHTVVDRMCAALDLDQLSDTEYRVVVDRVIKDAFTQRNKAVKDRYKDDLTVRQNEFLLEEIKGARPFILRVCEQRDYDWFASARRTDDLNID